jgi:anti-sigma-K factor RskA
MSTPNDELHELLGAYALDALDADDRARIERYLEASPSARAEVDELRETAAMLALGSAPSETAPVEIWDRIANDITDIDRDDARVAAPVTDLAARRGVPWKFAAPFAAAAAIIVALLAYQVVDLRSKADENRAVPTAAVFDRAADLPGAQPVALAGPGGQVARVVLLPDGTGYLLNEKLAPLGPQQTYQLWALVRGPQGDGRAPVAISAGVLGNAPRTAAFKVSAPVVGFALTRERAGGVISSDHNPIAVGNLPA